MSNKYPSTFIEQYPRKLAFLIDCANGLNGYALSSHTIDSFPANSDIFLFYHNNEPGMNRRFTRIESNHHGVFFFPTSENSISYSISYILGQINHTYDEFIIIVDYNLGYEDICQQLINNNSKLINHIQVRSFQYFNEFEQFLKEMTKLQNDNDNNNHKKKDENQTVVINYSRKHLFHPCPYESRDQSTILYRFGEFLQHIYNEHPNVYYDYCTECQQILDNHNLPERDNFEAHLRDKHWKNHGFQLILRHV